MEILGSVMTSGGGKHPLARADTCGREREKSATNWPKALTSARCASFLKTVEPIPAIDTFVESDWRIKRDPVGGVQAVRVLAGYESPEGKLDPEQARGYWFDDSGLLLKTYLGGVETDWSDFKDFSGFKVARQIDVRKDGRLGMRIRVTEVAPGASLPASNFEVKGHEWQRACTAEER